MLSVDVSQTPRGYAACSGTRRLREPARSTGARRSCKRRASSGRTTAPPRADEAALLLDAEQLVGAGLAALAAGGAVDGARGRVARDGDVRPEPGVAPDRDVVHERRVHAQEAVLADVDAPRHHHMGGDEDFVADPRVVTDVVAAPQHHVAADLHER